MGQGIWSWKCKDTLFQYNEAADTRLNQDGMAWNAYSGDGTIYQYNYCRLNEGGCVMFCLEESIHNIFRYNVRDDDWGEPSARQAIRTHTSITIHLSNEKVCRL